MFNLFNTIQIKIISSFLAIISLFSFNKFPIVENTNPRNQDQTTEINQQIKEPEKITIEETKKTEQKTTEIKPIPLPENKKLVNTTSTEQKTISSTTIQTIQQPVKINIPDNSKPWTQINTETRPAIVNIFCISEGSSLSVAAGSGIIIDKRGVILTNSHVSQYFLLQNIPELQKISCYIRDGDPAKMLYKAKLLYLPKDWIEDNYKKLKLQNPLGTGEFDFSLLLITQTIDPQTPFPTEFPFLPIDFSEITEKQDVLIAGYPAGFLGNLEILYNLYKASAVTKINDVLTFSKNNIDLISVGGTVISQKGSSGGAVVNNKGDLIGLVVTTTDATTTSSRDLRAITTAYINRAFENQKGLNIKDFLSRNLNVEANRFETEDAPNLTKKLLDGIK
ncbi:MAG: serine protease [Candidatus Paceibacterota bacterium]